MNKKISFLIVMSLILVLSACTSGSNEPDPQNEKSKGEEKDNLVIAFESDASTMIANADVNYVTDVQIRNIYDPLLELDESTAEYKPFLSKSWENIDELTWRMKLQEGVKFHNGADFNAESVKFSIDFILDEDNGSFYRSRWTDIEEVKVISPYEIEIKTSKPFPSLLQRIVEDLLIMEPGYINDVGLDEASKKPIGTGAYKFVDWSRDNYLKLEAFEDYWKGTPAIKTVEFRYIPEFSSRLSAFLSGEVDLFKNIPVDAVENVESADASKVENISSSRINYLALNTFYDGPMKDEKVRKAINYAIDVDELLESVLNGYGTKMTGPLSKINIGYVETEDYGYDPDKAIDLLKEAGYEPDSLSLTIDTPNGRYPMDSQVAQAITAQLQRIGVTVKVQVNEWGAHLDKIQNREMKDMFILGWGPAFDQQSTIENLFTEIAPYSGFSDKAIEEEIYATNTMFDKEDRFNGYAEIQKKLVNAAAWVPLWQQEDLYAVRDDLDFKPRLDEKFQVYEMSWEN